MAIKSKVVSWPRGVWEVTETEFIAAQAEADESPNAWQVVRYCHGWPFVGDMAKDWLKQHRAAELSTDAKFDALRAALA